MFEPKRMTKADHPHSLGAFKPVGHIVAAMPDDARGEAARRDLLGAGFEPEDVLTYSAAEEDDEMDRMLAQASDFAGFGHEIALMRRYQELARGGACWLIVYAPAAEACDRAVAVLRRHGALLAEKYHRLVVEDLI